VPNSIRLATNFRWLVIAATIRIVAYTDDNNSSQRTQKRQMRHLSVPAETTLNFKLTEPLEMPAP
jgi:hypothetical protein